MAPPATSRADLDPVVFDADMLNSVQRLIPPDRLRAYLVELDHEIRLVTEAAASERGLQERAHKIVSQAGMLGLTRMSQCARALEDACRFGAGQAEAIRQCRTAVEDIERYAMPATERGPATRAPTDDRRQPTDYRQASRRLGGI